MARKGKASRNIVEDVALKKRIDLLEKHVLSGITSTTQLAALAGVHPTAIYDDLKRLRECWQKELGHTQDERRHYRIKQLDRLLHLALNAFEKSQQNAEEYTVVERNCYACKGTGKDLSKKKTQEKECYFCGGQGTEEYLPGKYVRCEVCKGSGIEVDAPVCVECQGKGKVLLETTKKKGQAGDAAFLSIATKIVEAAAKLEGLMPLIGKNGLNPNESVDGVSGELQTRIIEMYYDTTPELLVKSLAVIGQIKKSIRKGETRLLDTTAVHIKPVEEDVDSDDVNSVE